jgi:hypothetical protein
MVEKPETKADGGKADTTAYSASKAPETKAEAEEKVSYGDWRLIPGGATGSHEAIGMSAIERAQVPSGGDKPLELDFKDSPDGLE